MQCILSLKETTELVANGCIATIGNFDGVHKGHQALIEKVCDLKKKYKLPAVVITFSPHPIFLFNPEKAPRLLMTEECRLRAIEKLGADSCLILPFTKELASLSPENFVKKILVDALSVKHLFVGHDYAFGKGRKGNAELLEKLGKKYNFTVEQIKAVFAEGGIVSSTRIRSCIEKGELALTEELLNRPYFVDGTIKHGKKRGGKELGFPTANLDLPENLALPRSGVYATKLVLNHNIDDCSPLTPPDDALYGVTNVGDNPTFGDVPLGVETHILDFDKEIYNSSMRLWFIDRIRDEEKFNSLDELKKQISNDTIVAKDILNKNKK